MNILFLCDEYPLCKHGGIGTVTQILSRELVRKGHHVFVHGFYPYYREALPVEDDLGVKVFRYFYGNKVSLKISENRFLGKIVNIKKNFYDYANTIFQFIRQNKIDIIEIPSFNESFRYSGSQVIRFPDFGIPKIVKYHGGDVYTKALYEKSNTLIQSAARIIAVSEFTKKEIQDIFCYRNSINVIYNGVDTNDAKRYEEELNSKNVIFAGKLSENKGVFSLVRAWGKVILRVPSARLFIYGRGSDKNIRKIGKLVNDKARSSIEVKGFIDTKMLPSIYSTSSCAIFPSYRERFSMAPMEAMKVGCPTIYTKRSSGPELISHGKNGLLVNPDDSDEIAGAIILLLTDRKYAIELGKNGKRTIHNKFNISRIADEHIKLYESAIRSYNSIDSPSA
jgi:glycosyltransferase involved in cell wall biosynthesis